MDATRSVVNALGVQTAGRFEQVDRRFDRLEAEMRAGFEKTDPGFLEVRAQLDQAAAGLQHVVNLINRLVPEQG